MTEPTIEFLNTQSFDVPAPYAATAITPVWLRTLKADPFTVSSPRQAMLRAAELGHFLPLPAEAVFRHYPDGRLSVVCDAPVNSHFAEQVRGTPLEGRYVAKFPNPWLVQTPAEWSSLMVAPLNWFGMPFEVLSGVVETDRFYGEVMFPALCGMIPGQTATMAPGTPLSQVIPVRREAWRGVVSNGPGGGASSSEADGGARVMEFIAEGAERYLAPGAAVKYLPTWLKTMPREFELPKRSGPGAEATADSGPQANPGASAEPHAAGTDLTVKQCPPFVEALSMGYLLPLEYDLEVTMQKPGEVSYRSNGPAVDTSVSMDFSGTPLEGLAVLRIKTPWRIKTPAGYSTLVLSPLNRMEMPARALAGLIDTDTDTDELVIPLVFAMQPGMTVVLPRGTAIAQLVPVERAAWRMEVGAVDAQKRQEKLEQFARNRHLYKDEHWVKKSWA